VTEQTRTEKRLDPYTPPGPWEPPVSDDAEIIHRYTRRQALLDGVRNDHDAPEPVTLKAVCGPDHDGSSCITVLLPGED
jgi:hypothetical protein